MINFIEGMLCGITIANALFNIFKPKKHPLESFFSSKILITIIRQNQRCKEILLEIPYDIKIGLTSISFFHCFIKNTIQAVKSKANEIIVIGLLRLLCEWISGSSESAIRFVEVTNNFLYFIDLLNNSKEKNVHIHALSGLLVGLIILEFKDHDKMTPGLYSKETIFDSVMNKVGVKNLEEKWNEFMKDPLFLQAEKEKGSKFKELYDLEFTQFFKESTKKIIMFLTQEEKRIKELIEKEREIKQTIEINETKRKENEILIEKLQEENSNLKKQISNELKQTKEEKKVLEGNIQKLTSDLKEITNKLNESEKSKREQVKEFQIRQSLLEGQIDGFQKQLESNTEQMRNSALMQLQAEEHLKNKDIEIEKLKHQMMKMSKSEEVENLNNQIHNLNDQIKTLLNNEESFDNERKRMIEIYQKVKEELQGKNTEIEQLKLNISTIQETYEVKIQQLIKKYQEEMITNQNRELKESNEGLIEELNEKHKIEISLLQTRIKTLEEEIVKKDVQIKEIEHDNEDMMDIIEKLEEKLKNNNKSLNL